MTALPGFRADELHTEAGQAEVFGSGSRLARRLLARLGDLRVELTRADGIAQLLEDGDHVRQRRSALESGQVLTGQIDGAVPEAEFAEELPVRFEPPVTVLATLPFSPFL